jgi:NADPH:quinone reductase-like Zn-dependent oxidoreductase
VRELGADHVVDHTGDLADQVRRIAPDGPTVVLHYAGDANALADLLADGGRIVSLLSFGPQQLGERQINTIPVYVAPARAVLDALAARVAEGALRMPIQQTYRLDEVPRAFGHFNTGKLGKIAIAID